MRATKLSFSLGREAEMILQIKGSTYEAQESSLCLFQFFLFCSSPACNAISVLGFSHSNRCGYFLVFFKFAIL